MVGFWLIVGSLTGVMLLFIVAFLVDWLEDRS